MISQLGKTYKTNSTSHQLKPVIGGNHKQTLGIMTPEV